MSQVSRFINFNQPIESLVGNDGVVVPPFYDGTRWDVFVLGAGHINTTGSIALSTLTINLDGGIADTYTTDAGVANPINYILEVFGGTNINTAAPLVPGNRIVINLDDNVDILGTFVSHMTITATGDITSTLGDVVATVGDVNAGNGMTANLNITTNAGSFIALAGNLLLPITLAGQGQIRVGGNIFISSFGTDNTFVGSLSGNTVLTGIQNCGFGSAAAAGLTTGSNNSFLGFGSGTNTTSGGDNTAVGSGSLSQLLTGSENIALGVASGGAYNAAQSSNICIGNIGLVGDNNIIRLGTDGAGAGQQTDCYIAGNTHITRNLVMPNTNVGGTVGIVTFGGAPYISNYGTNNFFLGDSAGGDAVTLTGERNTCLGRGSLQHLTTGDDNVALGDLSLVAVTTGNSNISIGSSCMGVLLTGNDNIAIGTNSASTYNAAQSSNICINNAGLVGDNNTIRIGTQGAGAGQQDTTFIAGIRAVAPATTDSGIVMIASDHQLGSTGAMTNGQLLIGSTGANPVLGTITAGTGINITNGAGSITADVVGGGMTWTVEAVNLAGAVNHGYLANKVGRLDVSLPAASAIGDVLSIVNIGVTADGWRITQGAGQTIWIGSSFSTTGVGGYIEATGIGDAIELVCFSANTEWIARSAPQGNITVV